MIDFGYLRERYPEVLSSEQLRQILHISKRKCVWMLQNGWIPCVDNHKKSRCYTIYLNDVIAYLIDSSQNPDKYVFPKLFSSGYQHPPTIPKQSPIPPECFRELLTDEWQDVQDIMTITEVALLTGYTGNTIDRWIVQKKLQSIVVQSGLITCKTWLIDFYCADGYKITQKSEKHIALIEKLLIKESL